MAGLRLQATGRRARSGHRWRRTPSNCGGDSRARRHNSQPDGHTVRQSRTLAALQRVRQKIPRRRMVPFSVEPGVCGPDVILVDAGSRNEWRQQHDDGERESPASSDEAHGPDAKAPQRDKPRNVEHKVRCQRIWANDKRNRRGTPTISAALAAYCFGVSLGKSIPLL